MKRSSSQLSRSSTIQQLARHSLILPNSSKHSSTRSQTIELPCTTRQRLCTQIVCSVLSPTRSARLIVQSLRQAFQTRSGCGLSVIQNTQLRVCMAAMQCDSASQRIAQCDAMRARWEAASVVRAWRRMLQLFGVMRGRERGDARRLCGCAYLKTDLEGAGPNARARMSASAALAEACVLFAPPAPLLDDAPAPCGDAPNGDSKSSAPLAPEDPAGCVNVMCASPSAPKPPEARVGSSNAPELRSSPLRSSKSRKPPPTGEADEAGGVRERRGEREREREREREAEADRERDRRLRAGREEEDLAFRRRRDASLSDPDPLREALELRLRLRDRDRDPLSLRLLSLPLPRLRRRPRSSPELPSLSEPNDENSDPCDRSESDREEREERDERDRSESEPESEPDPRRPRDLCFESEVFDLMSSRVRAA